jgi:hypothetical protein
MAEVRTALDYAEVLVEQDRPLERIEIKSFDIDGESLHSMEATTDDTETRADDLEEAPTAPPKDVDKITADDTSAPALS